MTRQPPGQRTNKRTAKRPTKRGPTKRGPTKPGTRTGARSSRAAARASYAPARQSLHAVSPTPGVTFGVLFEDDHLAIVHKRAGLVTQPGKGHEDDTLLNGLMARYAFKLSRLGAARDWGLIHRLDRETSGLLCVALTPGAYDHLREQFEQRTVRKYYWAITAKAPSTPAGLIELAITETEPKRLGEKKLAKVTRSGKPAVTAYRVVGLPPNPALPGALIECRPLTGRLHQIRVHLQAIGCPILGDGLYAAPKIAALAPRLALHAHRLAVTHPVTGVDIDRSSEFPKELRSTLKKLKLAVPGVQTTPLTPTTPAD
jgi:23S rRNA pseudouridine1911/1915/1917 synthase